MTTGRAAWRPPAPPGPALLAASRPALIEAPQAEGAAGGAGNLWLLVPAAKSLQSHRGPLETARSPLTPLSRWGNRHRGGRGVTSGAASLEDLRARRAARGYQVTSRGASPSVQPRSPSPLAPPASLRTCAPSSPHPAPPGGGCLHGPVAASASGGAFPLAFPAHFHVVWKTLLLRDNVSLHRPREGTRPLHRFTA